MGDESRCLAVAPSSLRVWLCGNIFVLTRACGFVVCVIIVVLNGIQWMKACVWIEMEEQNSHDTKER